MLSVSMAFVGCKKTFQPHSSKNMENLVAEKATKDSQLYGEKPTALLKVPDVANNALEPVCVIKIVPDSPDYPAESEERKYPDSTEVKLVIPQPDDEIQPIFNCLLEDDLTGVESPNATVASTVAELNDAENIEVMTEKKKQQKMMEKFEFDGFPNFESDRRPDTHILHIRRTANVSTGCYTFVSRLVLLDMFYFCTGIMLLGTGMIYHDKCPVSKYLPSIILAYGLTAVLTSVVKQAFRKCAQRSEYYMIFEGFVFIARGCMVGVGLIALNEIYRHSFPNLNDPNSNNYCSPFALWYAIGIFTITGVVYGITVIYGVVVTCCSCA